MASDDPDPYLADQTRVALAAAIRDLDHAKVSGPTRVLAWAVLRRLKGMSNYEAAMAGVELLSREIGKVSEILQRCADSLLAAEDAQAERLTPVSDIWWNTRIRAITREFRGERPVQGFVLWTRTWVDGLAAGAWPRCREVLSLESLPPDAADAADWMGAVTLALEVGDHTSALDPLEKLLKIGNPSESLVLESDEAVRLAVLRARILGREFADLGSWRQAAADALAYAGDDPRRRSLAHAAVAENQLAAGDAEAARVSLEEADPTRPIVEVLVMSALLSEHDGLWAQADADYDRALEADPAATWPQLLRPVPARLLIRAARSEHMPSATAVQLLERALAAGVQGEGDYPDGEVHLARARRLLRLAEEQDLMKDTPADETGQAAETSRARAAYSLMEAGRRYAASGLTPEAVALYQEACSLAPEEAEYRWTWAEALRIMAYRPDGTLDHELFAAASQQMQSGLNIALPDRDESWAFITAALIEDNLPEPHHRPALLAERALLLEPDYDGGHTFLALILRGRGWLQEAYEVTSERLGPALLGDDFLFATHLGLLLDLEEREEALEALDRRQHWSDDDVLVMQRATVLLSLGKERAPEALAILAGAKPTDYVRILSADATYASGDVAGAREQYASIWADARSSPASQVAGWAAFRAGQVSEAIAIYRELVERADPRAAFARDLGQMLLVRGDAGDLDEGRGLLERGIDACPIAEELMRVESSELEYVRDVTASTPHGGVVSDIVQALGKRIRGRIDVIRGARRPPHEVAVRLAEARRHLSAGRPLDAVAIYVDLASDPQVPEVEHGLLRSVRAARDAADRLFQEEARDEAKPQWFAAEQALARLRSDEAQDLRVTLTCRRMVANLIHGDYDEVALWLDTVNIDMVLPELRGAVRVLAHDPPSLWSFHDGLQNVGRQSHSSWAGTLPGDVFETEQVERAYGLAAAEVDSHHAAFLTVNPLELRLGPGLEDLGDSTLLAALQLRIEEDTGVRTPWLHATSAPQLPESRAEVRVYGRLVGRLTVGGTGTLGDRDARLHELMAAVEAILRSHLYRLVGVDDVPLWLEGWDLTQVDGPRWEPTDPLNDQLRLARVLRMLIREGVSVRDRQAIVAGLNAATNSDRHGPAATLDALREVRRGLGPSALGIVADSVVHVPEELERRIADGLDPQRPVWVRSREEAHLLVTDLRAWLQAQPQRPAVICVEDPLVRPFAWRLLAAEHPPIGVVSLEELP